jgi:hypothetical protein
MSIGSGVEFIEQFLPFLQDRNGILALHEQIGEEGISGFILSHLGEAQAEHFQADHVNEDAELPSRLQQQALDALESAFYVGRAKMEFVSGEGQFNLTHECVGMECVLTIAWPRVPATV